VAEHNPDARFVPRQTIGQKRSPASLIPSLKKLTGLRPAFSTPNSVPGPLLRGVSRSGDYAPLSKPKVHRLMRAITGEQPTSMTANIAPASLSLRDTV
jgi:hypothetical protein